MWWWGCSFPRRSGVSSGSWGFCAPEFKEKVATRALSGDFMGMRHVWVDALINAFSFEGVILWLGALLHELPPAAR